LSRKEFSAAPGRVADPGKISPQPLVKRSTEAPKNIPQRENGKDFSAALVISMAESGEDFSAALG
jgi:hypothetical protein